MMKRMLVISICLAVGLLGSFSFDHKDVGAKDTKTYNFTNHTYTGDAYYFMEVIRWFYEQLNERTHGRLTAEHFYSQALTKAADQVSACSNGVIDSFFNSLGYNPSQFVLNRVFEHVCITGSFDVQAKAIMDLYENEPMIRQEWDRQNLVLIAPVLQTEMVLMTKKPIKTIEDLKGIKLRGYAQSGKALEKLGAEIVTIAAPERYDAMAKGVVDGMSGIALDVGYSERLFEAAPYITDVGLGVYSFTYFAMNKKLFNKLSKKDQQIIRGLGKEMTDKMVTGFSPIHQKMITEMVKRQGVKMYEFTPEEKQRVFKTVTPYVWQDWIAETEKLGLPGQKILDEYMTAIEKYKETDHYTNPWKTYNRIFDPQ